MKKLFKNPYFKGQYEHLEARKRQQLCLTLVCGFWVVVFVTAGILIYHNTRNTLTIPAVLMVLPTANFFVTWLALLKGKPLEPARREELKAYEESGMALFHLLYVDEKSKRFYLQHVTVYQNAIVAYGPGVPEDQRVPLESDCVMRMRKKGVNLRLKVFRDWDAYRKRLEEIAPEVPENQVRLVEKAQEALIGMSL